MTALVHVSGRKDPERFERWSDAEIRRSDVVRSGRFAWVEYVR